VSLVTAFHLATATAASPGTLTVLGDSYADAGTFGRRVTAQTKDAAVFAEHVAAALGLRLCNAYVARSPTVVVDRGEKHCTARAVAGARINWAVATDTALDIVRQMRDAAESSVVLPDGWWLVQGGINDILFLAGSWQGMTPNEAPFRSTLASLLPAADLPPADAGLEAQARAGAAYMRRLADRLAVAARELALDKGAQRVILLNMPDLTHTPMIRRVLNNQRMGPGQPAGALRAALSAWVDAYNQQLAARFASEPRVLLFDFHAWTADVANRPATLGFNNASDALCPPSSVGPGGLRLFDLARCDTTTLATIPGWQGYAWADDLHLSPRAHDALAHSILSALAAKGWR
jgi:phospholipase/lecithinase/hemolysin